MHTDNLKPMRLLAVDDKGNEIELQGTVELEQSYPYEDIDPYKDLSISQWTMSVNIEKSETISRKKFIKLLMSKGIQRNGANEIAKYILNKNGKYSLMDLLKW